jgi:hypothetical protein
MASIRRRATRPIDDGLSNWSVRRVISWSLFALAPLIAVQHLVAHAGWRPIPLSMGWQDILIGYPTAGVLLVVGLLALDPNPRI